MQNRIALCLLALAATGSQAAKPATIPGPAFPSFETPAALEARCTRDLGRAGAALAKLVRVRGGPRWLASRMALSGCTLAKKATGLDMSSSRPLRSS